MTNTTHGSKAIRTEETGTFSDYQKQLIEKYCKGEITGEKFVEDIDNSITDRSAEFMLLPCDVCLQMTNHIGGDCQKCAEKLRREAMSPDDELIEYLRSAEHRTAIAIEVLREKLEEVDSMERDTKELWFDYYEHVSALEKSIELLTKNE